MNEVIKLRALAEIEEEAAAWVWRLDTESVSGEDRQAFEKWLRRDARHARAFADLGGVWRSLDALAEAKREEKLATFASYPLPRFRERVGVRAVFFSALAAMILVSLAISGWFQRGAESQTLGTAVGQHRSVTLADGSAVSLNTNTILETHFAREQRTIRLLKGEALFKVAADPRRPFIVHAGETTVRALGTEFNVRLQDTKEVQVIVAEGRVEVESPASKRALAAGQRIDTAALREPVAAIDSEALSNALAWRSGAIVFEGEPLARAIAELNRYTDTRFIVTDPQVRDLRVGGRFKAGDVAEFLSALEKALPVSARRTADNLVYIEPRH